ncbi:N-acetylglucosamine-6-phosphate deacetylase [Cohnella sp. AR92]|uniref:N-acetylglucosamine-6-phosphate deacetylase n=1 Tax=Cohnella sp. AR92 TaxID=648716 RepID=UPI000F8CE497|nr:N-acetylglucosamine-6-phosphate deacetylase [Cohnella sp. AR92]RUS45373.1 N-acetylglucosamine-6-phosphate deacetylase [Cohnella sp. AR92]
MSNTAEEARVGSTLIVHASIVTANQVIENGWIWMREGRIERIGLAEDALPDTADALNRIDAEGGWVIPGFVDVHVHGGAGHDFMDADQAGLDAIARFHASHGTTSLLATSLTASREELTEVLRRVGDYRSRPMPYAQIVGVHFEGPFISEKWKGAQNPDYILPLQKEWLLEWVREFPGLIKLQTLSPESEGALDYIELLVENGIVPSCGHTDATYDEVIAAADRGLRHAVHTFNAMKPLHHREPGTVGAVLTDDRIAAEVISDGHHVHAGAIKLITRAKGPDKVILVTDAMAAAGMPDGDDYDLGGLPVVMKCGVARLKESGNLAGSTLTMIGAFQHMVRAVGVSVEDASKMASGNPARQIGIDAFAGTLAAGKRADVLLLDSSLELKQVWVGGAAHSAE